MNTNPFSSSSVADELFQEFKRRVSEIGTFDEEMKKTCAHLVVGKGAFAGVHPRASGLLITLALDHALDSARVHKSEQASRTRFHCDVRIAEIADFDEEFMGWVREAYVLKAGVGS